MKDRKNRKLRIVQRYDLQITYSFISSVIVSCTTNNRICICLMRHEAQKETKLSFLCLMRIQNDMIIRKVLDNLQILIIYE